MYGAHTNDVTRMQVRHLEWSYVLPQRLANRVQPTGTLVTQQQGSPVPQYQRPDFCDGIKDDVHNAQFLAFENHPCMYLAAGFRFPATVEELFA